MIDLIECPAPGIYYDIPEDTYHAWDAVSQTLLKQLKKSRLHLKDYLEGGFTQTKAMAFGEICHDLILRPSQFGGKYTLSDDCQRPFKTGPRAGIPCGSPGTHQLGSDWFCGNHKPEGSKQPKNLITTDESRRARAIRDKLMENDVAGEVLGGAGATEVSMVWIDPKTGLLCKGRIDRVGAYRGFSIFLDLKKAADASPRKFGYQSADLGYHIQGGFYLNGAHVLTPEIKRRYVLLAFEEDYPFHFGPYEMDEPDIHKVQSKIMGLMRDMKKIKDEPEPDYPSYVPQGIEILRLPPFE